MGLSSLWVPGSGLDLFSQEGHRSQQGQGSHRPRSPGRGLCCPPLQGWGWEAFTPPQLGVWPRLGALWGQLLPTPWDVAPKAGVVVGLAWDLAQL